MQEFKIERTCPKCGRGLLVSDDNVGAESKTGRFALACSDITCDYKCWSKKLYPAFEYRSINEEIETVPDTLEYELEER
jgi:hypothetical protein